MLKPINAESSVECVFYGDEAFEEMSTEDIQAYVREAMRNPGCWRDKLKPKPGAKPTVFRIGVIPPDDLCIIEDQFQGDTSSRGFAWLCFIKSVRDIKDGPTVTNTSPTGAQTEVVPKVKTSAGIEYVEPSFLQTMFARQNRIAALFVGRIAYAWNQVSEDDAKN